MCSVDCPDCGLPAAIKPGDCCGRCGLSWEEFLAAEELWDALRANAKETV